MKKILFIAIALILPLAVFAQTAEEYFKKGEEYYRSKDFQNALLYYKKAAEMNHSKAMYNIGDLYSSGKGVVKDKQEAFKWYKMSADHNNYYGLMKMGDFCREGNLMVNKNYKKAIEWYEKAHKVEPSFFDLAQDNIGDIYRFGGYGVEKDYKKAIDYYRQSLDHNSLLIIGGLFEEGGYGIDLDYNISAFYYSLAVNKFPKSDFAKKALNDVKTKISQQDGNTKTSNNKEEFYKIGILCKEKKDFSNALIWLQKAAEQNSSEAQAAIGSMFYNGQGVAQDFGKAMEWYQKAAIQDDSFAQNELGKLYEKGRGVSQDYAKAAEWYEKAAKQGHVTAQKNLARIQGLMSTESPKQDLKIASERKESIAQNNVSKVQTQAKKTEEPAKTSSSTPRNQTAITTIVMPDVDKDIPLTTVKNPNLLAVIIGNENYRKLPDVPYAENDARMFKEYCEKTLGVTKEHIRYLPNAGLVDIYDARDWLKTGAESYGNDASVIFYYAGHGLPNRETGMPYILPVEVDGSNLKLAVSLQELYDEFGKLPARSVTVFLDACFTGVDRENNVVASREGERLAFKMSPKIPTPTGKTIVFSATENNQTAHPFKDRNHGFFTYFLLRKLQESKGEATLGEIADFVSNGVRRTVFDKIQTSQTPSVKPSSNFANDWRQMKFK